MRKSTMDLCADTPVSNLYGIGPKKAEAFERLSILTLRDLCYHFPRAYENRGNVIKLSEAEDGEICAFLLTVASTPKSVQIRRGMVITKLSGFDESGKCNITFFNSPYVKDTLRVGSEYRFYGKVTFKNGRAEMTSPVYEPYVQGSVLRRFVSVYPLTDGISQKQMIGAVSAAVDAFTADPLKFGLEDFLPERIREKYSLVDLNFAIKSIHFPNCYDDVAKARRRLAFDELFLLSLSSVTGGGREKLVPGPKFDTSVGSGFMKYLKYTPTNAQMRTIREINLDMSSGHRMSRLITGDVGSGKTMCAAYALYVALENGYQAALMAPTEILATQHYLSLSPIFEKAGYKCELLIGALTSSKKKKICDSLLFGSPVVVIGTHALIEDSVVFSRLGLVVIDEQHRFGAAQRERLKNKSQNAHLLSMSATPIPRTLAHVLYGDLDISSIDEMPPGRQIVDTFVVDEGYRSRLDAFIMKNVDSGGQVYIVCPSVEEQEMLEGEGGDKIPLSSLEMFAENNFECKPKLKAAVNYAEELQNKFPNLSVGFIHGKLKSAAKDKIMSEFVSGKIDVLVSTTVIEVGVNVPRATLMIIENAEFFGLSGLHQLRGRVGRGDKKSYCVLVSDSKSAKSRERLNILKTTHDGYKIAEYDLEIRGPGDFISESGKKIRQSGEIDLKLAELVGDKELLYSASESAHELYTKDPFLTNPDNLPLLREISRIMSKGSKSL